jgi:tRNA dimethylallyltransferase
MLTGGAIEEVRAIRASGVEPSPTAARILGLAQIGAYLDGRATLAECAAEITLRSGQYARRQETWARRMPGAIELPGGDGPERNADRLLELIR